MESCIKTRTGSNVYIDKYGHVSNLKDVMTLIINRDYQCAHIVYNYSLETQESPSLELGTQSEVDNVVSMTLAFNIKLYRWYPLRTNLFIVQSTDSLSTMRDAIQKFIPCNGTYIVDIVDDVCDANIQTLLLNIRKMMIFNNTEGKYNDNYQLLLRNGRRTTIDEMKMIADNLGMLCVGFCLDIRNFYVAGISQFNTKEHVDSFFSLLSDSGILSKVVVLYLNDSKDMYNSRKNNVTYNVTESVGVGHIWKEMRSSSYIKDAVNRIIYYCEINKIDIVSECTSSLKTIEHIRNQNILDCTT